MTLGGLEPRMLRGSMVKDEVMQNTNIVFIANIYEMAKVIHSTEAWIDTLIVSYVIATIYPRTEKYWTQPNIVHTEFG